MLPLRRVAVALSSSSLLRPRRVWLHRCAASAVTSVVCTPCCACSSSSGSGNNKSAAARRGDATAADDAEAYAADATILDVASRVVAAATSGNGDDDGDSTAGGTTPPHDAATPSSASRRPRRRRRNTRKNSVDAILNDVLHDALRMRDRGEAPTTAFIYQRAQERLYNTTRAGKGTGAQEAMLQYVPHPPTFTLQRLLRLWSTATVDDDDEDNAYAAQREQQMHAPTDATSTTSHTAGSSSGDAAYDAFAAVTTPSSATTATRRRPRSTNYLHTYSLMADDPWPERAITPDNPVWTEAEAEADVRATGGAARRAHEARMYAPRPGHRPACEFADAVEELAYWESALVRFVREVPLWQRRTLPFLHESYRMLVHRIVRAERRYAATRDAALTAARADSALYARTEDALRRVRGFYAEVHRSLSTANYDPAHARHATLAALLRMTDAEYDEWCAEQRRQRNALVAELD